MLSKCFRTTAARCALRQSAKAVQLAATQARLFSTPASVSKLTKALDKEIKYENENYTQLDDIDTFLKESGFEYSEEENGITLTLTKQVGNHKVEVQFESR